MIELDHTSVGALMTDLRRHQGGVFRIRYADGATSPQWMLRTVAPGPSRAYVDLGVEYGSMCGGTWTRDTPADSNLVLWLNRVSFTGGIPMTVVLVRSNSSVDDSQRRELDGNLRGVFA